MYLNKAVILGNLTRDPELKALPTGMKVASFSIATNRSWKDQAGKKQEAVEYHNVVAFGKSAELIYQYVKKGNQLYVEGRIQTRSWDDKTSGEKKYRTEIVVEQFQFGNNKPADGTKPAYKKPDQDLEDYGKSEEDRAKPVEPTVYMDDPNYPDEHINAEDIPF